LLTEVRLPKLGMSMKKGMLKRWLVAEGDPVEKGAPLYELMTDKVNAVIEAPASGVVGRVVAPDGTELPVGGLVAVIGAPGDSFPPLDELAGQASPLPPTPSPAAWGGGAQAAGAVSPVPAGAGGEVLASPAARRVARELGVDLALVTPSAPGKRITVDDVEAFAARTDGGVSVAASRRPFEGIRSVVAEHLTSSLREMAQVTVSREVDASGLVRRRTELAPGFQVATEIHLTYTDLLVQDVARLLTEEEHRVLNATLDGETIVVPDAVHMGVAVALDDGLIVPVIRDAHARPLLEIARARADLAARATGGTLGLDEIEGGTFTITNLGAFGADSFTPIVNPPQCAILVVGRIVEKPAVVDGQVVIRPMVWLSLTFDHRLVDGAPAARFLSALADRLGVRPETRPRDEGHR